MVALIFGAIIGWSRVVLTGVWIEGAGTLGAVLAFLLGGSVMVLIGLTYAELAGRGIFSHCLPYRGAAAGTAKTS